jgi:hypothetical protein
MTATRCHSTSSLCAVKRACTRQQSSHYAGLIDSAEYFALTAGKKNPAPPPAPNDLSRWISEGQWSALDALCASVAAFGSFAKEMDKNSDDWEKWCGHAQPETVKVPGEWGKPLPARDQEVCPSIVAFNQNRIACSAWFLCCTLACTGVAKVLPSLPSAAHQLHRAVCAA